MSNMLFQVNKEELEIRMERVFDAPRDRVWKTYTDPLAIPAWWGPRNLITIVENMDVQPGGLWRFVQRDEKGEEYAFYGEYREVEVPERIMQTFIFEPYPDHILVDSITFEELPDGKTKVRSVSEFSSIEGLEGMIQNGMEEGATESWDRLAELLASQDKQSN